LRSNVVTLFDEAPTPRTETRFEEVWKLPRHRSSGKLARSPIRGMEFIEAMSMPEPNSGCWIWLGAFDKKGYGRISRVSYGTGAAHRYSLTSTVGDIGELHALHHCDNPACVNPGHLYGGTPRQNTDDMMRKGRHRSTKGYRLGRRSK
jgi:hypothetical protein